MITFARAPRYRAWILRCWEVGGAAAPQATSWQFSLEDPHTRKRQGFASMEALVAFLLDELTPPSGPPEGGASPDDSPAGNTLAGRSATG